MLQLTRKGLIIGDTDQLGHLREEFAHRHAVVLPKFLGEDVLEYLWQRLCSAQFATRSDYTLSGEEFARELTVKGYDLSVHFLRVLLNSARLFQVLQTLTGCSAIGNFQGRIYKMAADVGHFDTWHSDTGDGKLLGLSINLSRESYKGGVFQLREKRSSLSPCNIAHTEPGNAHLFRIATELEHRVTQIEGEAVRIVAAGWFHEGPNLRELLDQESGDTQK